MLFCESCSVLLSSDATQCQSNADCARFGPAICNTERHVCAPSPSVPVDGGVRDTAGADTALVCHVPGGCFQCTPVTDPEFLSACTDSTCIPFDNSRLTNVNYDGTLKLLP